MINTIAEGHNSGRTYYLQASSKGNCTEMVRLLKALSKKERERAAAQTRFAKVQLRARKLFSSYWFQLSSATLIVAASPLSRPCPSRRELTAPSSPERRTSSSASSSHSTAA